MMVVMEPKEEIVRESESTGIDKCDQCAIIRLWSWRGGGGGELSGLGNIGTVLHTKLN